MAQEKEKTVEIVEIPEKEALASLREVYKDGEAAFKFFGVYVSQRQAAFKTFDQELRKNEELAAEFSRNPIGVLADRHLVGPLDQVHIEGLPNPFHPLPWPLPHCRLVCRIECRPEVHWVCIRIFGFRICWPVFHIHCRWVCRIVCS